MTVHSPMCPAAPLLDCAFWCGLTKAVTRRRSTYRGDNSTTCKFLPTDQGSPCFRDRVAVAMFGFTNSRGQLLRVLPLRPRTQLRYGRRIARTSITSRLVQGAPWIRPLYSADRLTAVTK